MNVGDPSQPEVLVESMRHAVAAGMPEVSAVLYGRWWQLETWLRQLFYLEIRSRDGSAWVDALDSRTVKRWEADEVRAYMASPDSDDPLAYLDAGQLFALLEQNWDLVGNSLIARRVWEGRTEELLAIRHRIGHLRRPHQDDLGRILQTLRDLERGAVETIRSYKRLVDTADNISDPVVRAWVGREHEAAQRLIQHAASQYRLDFYLSYSIRPWSKVLAEGSDVSGTPGVVWHIRFHSRGGIYLRLPNLWNELPEATRRLLLHVLSDGVGDVVFTIPTVDDPGDIANAIGELFESILVTSSSQPPAWMNDEFFVNPRSAPTPADFRVLVGTPWNIVDDYAYPITIFGA